MLHKILHKIIGCCALLAFGLGCFAAAFFFYQKLPFSTDGSSPVTKEALPLTPAVVLKVTDGDTLYVSVTDELSGEAVTNWVRLLYCDAPESVAPEAYHKPNTEQGRLASEYAATLVTRGDTVYLSDAGQDTDNYGRWLRLVWLEIPDDPASPDEIAAKTMNARMISAGYARADRVSGTAYDDLFTDLEKTARNEERGLWMETHE